MAIRSGGHLALSPAGVKALSTSPADVLRMLWCEWLETTMADQFSRIDAIKGQTSRERVMSVVAPRRAAIVAALRACAVCRWAATDEFSRFMQASDLVLALAHSTPVPSFGTGTKRASIAGSGVVVAGHPTIGWLLSLRQRVGAAGDFRHPLQRPPLP